MIELSKRKNPSIMHSENLTALSTAAKNDPAAFGKLYDHFLQPVYRYIRSRVATNQEAEDITSQTFIAAFEGLRGYRERGFFSAWLFRIARSKLMDHFRRGKIELPLETLENLGESADALGRVARDEDARKLVRLIRGLDDGDRELIRLRYVAELSFAEMAEVLGKREDAVKKSLYRLLANLKSQME